MLKGERTLLRQEQRERDKATGMLMAHVNTTAWLQYRAAAPRDPEESLRPPAGTEGQNGYDGNSLAVQAVQHLESLKAQYEQGATKARFNEPPYED